MAQLWQQKYDKAGWDVCAHCDAREHIDPDTGCCARCLYDAAILGWLQVTWDHPDEDSPEYKAAEHALDTLEEVGLARVERIIDKRRLELRL